MQAITQARTADKVTIDDMNLSQGKRARLYRLLYLHGPANGTLMPLPVDQGLEHGPRDFFDNPDSIHPEYEIKVAIDGGFSAIVFQIGIAERYMYKYTGKLPLILKLNGKTEIPSDGAALSPCVASVEDAVRIGADAVGYTLYVGSPCQVQDFVQFREVRSEAERMACRSLFGPILGETLSKARAAGTAYTLSTTRRASLPNSVRTL